MPDETQPKPTLGDHWAVAKMATEHFLADCRMRPDDGRRSYALLVFCDADMVITALTELRDAAWAVWEGQGG
jgi:uncharacterized protein with von Willebrand factor type A (vWA) domain